jgi:tellurite resistance protein TerC
MRHVKKIVVLIVGGTVLLIGIIMIFLPGPSFIVIPVGLGILAVEFAWARSLLKKARHMVANIAPRRWRGNKSKETPPDRLP